MSESVKRDQDDVERIQAEAVEIANAVQAIAAGRNTVAVYTALGMVIGHSAAQAVHPDLPGLLRIVKRVARGEYADTRRRAETEAAQVAVPKH